MKTVLHSLRLLAVLTLLTGGVYPLAVWAIGHGFFRAQAEGSLLLRDGRVVGSSLLAQKTADPRYFQPRPSAGDYATVPSGASNQGWTSARLAADIATRRAAFDSETARVPPDLLTASGSGLDPHVSPEAARLQAGRVAAARSLDTGRRRKLDELVARHTEGGQFTPPRVNVFLLNLALDAAFPLR